MALNTPIAQVKSLDHLVLTVADIDATAGFYTKFLGMKHESFAAAQGGQRHALIFGSQKINLHKSHAEFEPKAGHVMPGSADLCFLTDTKIDDVLVGLKAASIIVLEGGKVVDRTGARGHLRSVYIRDPDENLVE